MVVARMPSAIQDDPGHYSQDTLADIEELSSSLASVPEYNWQMPVLESEEQG